MSKQDHRVRTLAVIAERMGRDIGNSDYARRIKAEADNMAAQAAMLDAHNAKRPPTKTREAHMLEVAASARKFHLNSTASLNRALEAYRAGVKDIQRRIDEKANLKPDPKYEMAVLNRFVSLDDKAKTDALAEMVEQGRGPEFAAIAKAPAFVTGIPVDRLAALERAYVAKHAPEELSERSQLDSAFEAISTVSSTAAAFTESLTDPGRLAEIEREEAAAIAAAEACGQSLQ